MTTQRQQALKGNITKEMQEVAEEESVSPQVLREKIAEGKVVIPFNPRHKNVKPIGIGQNLRTKVNANLGTSPDFPEVQNELEKLKVCLAAKADAVMDLSTAGDLDHIRREIIKHSPLPVGTVPIYQAAIKAGAIEKMKVDDLFETIEKHAEDGADFMTVHAGVTLKTVEKLKNHPRIMDVVSRGGAFLFAWMLANEKENPLYEKFGRLLEIALKYDVTLSLGDGLRPGCIADSGDSAQIQELLTLAELAKLAWSAGVQVIIEGPGHVPLDQIEAQVKLQKSVCSGAPFYLLGPLPTDIAPGYDHITSAIGGAIAAAAGADFLCYVTPSEHLGLPTLEDVKDGIIASRIAAHSADIVKGIPQAKDWDLKMSKARKALDWEKQIALSIDPEKAKELKSRASKSKDVCSMCGEFCALKIMSQCLKKF